MCQARGQVAVNHGGGMMVRRRNRFGVAALWWTAVAESVSYSIVESGGEVSRNQREMAGRWCSLKRHGRQ
jgi:hypothetical protein